MVTLEQDGVKVEAEAVRKAQAAFRKAQAAHEAARRARAKDYAIADKDAAAAVGRLVLYPASADLLTLATDSIAIEWDTDLSEWFCILPGGARARLGDNPLEPRAIDDSAGIRFVYCGPADGRVLSVFGEHNGVAAWAEIPTSSPVYNLIPRE
jgi:hypothetical protein